MAIITPTNIQVQLTWGMAGGRYHVYSRVFSCQALFLLAPVYFLVPGSMSSSICVADYCGSHPQPVTPSWVVSPAVLFSANWSIHSVSLSPIWNLFSVQVSCLHSLYLRDACLCILLTHPLIGCICFTTCSPVSFRWSLILAKQGSLAHLFFILFLWLKAWKAQGGVLTGGQHPVFIS